MPEASFPIANWPSAATVAEFGLSTPVLAIDLDHLGHLARSILEQHRSCQIDWHPTLPFPLDIPQFHGLYNAGLVVFSLSCLPASSALSRKHLSVNLLRPPIVAASPARLGNALDSWEITVVCDHFVQVESLAWAARQADLTVAIDLRVDVGPQRWGVSPGSELRDLARGTTHLRGARLRGLHLPAWRPISPADPPRFRSDEYIRLAQAAVRSLREIGSEPELVLVDTLETALLLQDSSLNMPLATRAPLPADHIRVMAGVVARPLRELAILDVGLFDVGSAPMLPLDSPWHAEAILMDGLRIRCGVGGHDLAIGDVLPVRPSHDFSVSRELPWLVKRQGLWKRLME